MRRLIACAGGSAILVLSLAGCIMEASSWADFADLEIVNQSDVELSIATDDVTWRTVDPHGRASPGLTGDGDDCADWTVRAPADGVEVSRIGPPVCGGDKWVITQDDVKDAS